MLPLPVELLGYDEETAADGGYVRNDDIITFRLPNPVISLRVLTWSERCFCCLVDIWRGGSAEVVLLHGGSGTVLFDDVWQLVIPAIIEHLKNTFNYYLLKTKYKLNNAPH